MFRWVPIHPGHNSNRKYGRWIGTFSVQKAALSVSILSSKIRPPVPLKKSQFALQHQFNNLALLHWMMKWWKPLDYAKMHSFACRKAFCPEDVACSFLVRLYSVSRNHSYHTVFFTCRSVFELLIFTSKVIQFLKIDFCVNFVFETQISL